MDEKYIEYLYNSLGGHDRFGEYDSFKQGISTDDAFRKDFYSQVGNAIGGSYEELEGAVKKKEDGAVSGPGDSASSLAKAATGVLGSRELAPSNFLKSVQPSYILNTRQQAEFAKQGGYVMEPTKAKELATTLYEKPVSDVDRDKDRLIDIVGSQFQKKQDTQEWLATQQVKMAGAIYDPTQANAEILNRTQQALGKDGYGNAITFVDQALQNNDYATLRDITNNYYGSEQAKVKGEYVTAAPMDAVQAQQAEAGRIVERPAPTEKQINEGYQQMKQQNYAQVEEAEKRLAPIKQEQQRTNMLLDKLSSKLYAVTNPDVVEAYNQETIINQKPLKNEITQNQYTGLRYFKDNNPELYNQISTEIAKAADPQTFGRNGYDKQNRDYQYAQYVLDKKGSELNAMAIDQHLQEVAPAKGQADQEFKTKLDELTQARQQATNYEERKAIQDQINLVQSQYQLNPAVKRVGALLDDLSTADVDFNKKYPDYASRSREQMAKDLLQNDGLKWWEELTPRVSWLFNNTVTGIANITGLNELEFGQSRNYLRNIRKAEQQQFETYQPTENAAVQALYKLNLEAKDYKAIQEIKDSELPVDEQLKAAADYLDANKNRITYVPNAQAGKQNWTWGAIGNQVADVGSQVLYQGALTYMTAGAARAALGVEGAAAIEAGASVDAGAAVTAESLFGPAATVASDLSASTTALKSKLINLGSIFGSTYATAYQPAYQSALQAGKGVEEAASYANQIAIVNGLSETISPDIEVLKRSAAGIRGVAAAISPSSLSLAQRFGRGAAAAGKGYVHNVVPETLEEVAAAYGEYGVDALHNMNQDEMNELNARIKNATITTVIGMTPFAAFSGAASVRNQSQMVKEQFYQAGLYPDVIRGEIHALLDNGAISQEEANRRISVVGTMANIVRDIPPNLDGREMSDNAKQDYALARLKEAIANKSMETTTDPNAQEALQEQINTAVEEQQIILNGVEVPAGSGLEAAVPGAAEENQAQALDYQVGDMLHNPELGNFVVIAAEPENDIYKIRFPDGNTEDFTSNEIETLIRPERTVTPVTAEQLNPAAEEQPGAVTIEQPAAGAEQASVTVTVPEGEAQVAEEQRSGEAEQPAQNSSPINTTENATTEIQQQESIQQQRPQGNESGQTTETGSSDSIQPTESVQEEGEINPLPSDRLVAPEDEDQPINENAGLTAQQVDTIDKMGSEDLYKFILSQDPENVVRNRKNEYSTEQLRGIYKGLLSDHTVGLENTPLGDDSATPLANRATPGPVLEATRNYNQARDLADQRRTERNSVADKNSTEYQDKNKQFEQAQAAAEEAEDKYLQALQEQNRDLREKKRRNLGISPEGNAQADARIVANYIEMARIYSRKGVRSLKEFSAKIGEQINDYMRKAWEATVGNDAPTKRENESNKEYLARLREWESERVDNSQSREERRATKQEAAELRTGVRLLRNGVKILEANLNTSREQFNNQLRIEADDYATYVAALKSVIENNREQRTSAKEIMNSLRETNPQAVITTEMDLLRMQLSAEQRGSRYGYKEGKREKTAPAKQEVRDKLTAVRNQVQQVLDGMFDSGLLDSGNFDQNDMQELANRVNNISTERQINALKNLFQRLVTNSSEARTIEEIGKLQKKLGTIIRNKDTITANLKRKNPVVGNKGLLRALKNLNPLKISQPLRYNAILDNVVNSLAGTAVLEYSTQQIQDFITAQQGYMVSEDAADLKARYGQTLNVMESIDPNYNPDQVLDQQEFDAMVDNIANDPNLSVEQRGQELNNLYSAVQAYQNEIESGSGIDPQTGEVEAQLTDIYQETRQGSNRAPTEKVQNALVQVVARDQEYLGMALNAPDLVATDQQREWLKDMQQLDPSRLQPKQLILLKNTMDNFFANGDFGAAQYFSAVQQSQQKVNNFSSWAATQAQNLKTDSFSPDGLLTGYIGQAAADISSSDQTVLTIANNSRDYAVRLMDVSNLGDIKADHAQAQQVIDKEVNKPLNELRKKYKKEGIRKAESVYKRGMYAYLNENNYGTPEEQQQEFIRRKNLVAQDIAIKEEIAQSGDKEIEKEVKVLRKIFDDNFAGVTSQDELQSAGILSQGEKAIYDLFRGFYDSHKDSFREVMETLLNQPFHDVNNYVKDSYRILDTGLADADFRDIDQSNFYNEREQASPSTATMQRNSFTDLDNVTVRDMEGNIVSRRGINYNFDLAQLNNTRAMIEDIYTLKDRIAAKMALNDPALRDSIGVSNQRRLAKTVKQQVQQQMGLFATPEQGVAGEWAGKAASTLNKIGVRQVLYSVGQIPKQLVDIVSNTVVNLGKDAPLYWEAFAAYKLTGNEELNGLLDQSEIGVRGKTVGGTQWMTPTAMNQVQQLIRGMGSDAELENSDKFAKLIESPDTYGSRVAWLAYYMQSLKRQGLINSAKDVDWTKENRDINKEARDYAQVMTSTRLNVNSSNSQSAFYSKFAGFGRLFQVIFLPLSSFSMNNYATMYRDINTLFTADTQEQKGTAMRSIASRVTAELTFQMTRGLLSMLLKQGVRSILEAAGIEPPAKKEEEFWKKVFSEAAKNMMFSMLGNFAQDAIVGGINWLSDKAFDTELIQQYDKNPNNPSNNFGMASISGNSVQGMWNYARDLIGRTDPNGNPIELTLGQKVVLATAFVTNLMAMRGKMVGEVKQMADAAAKQVNMDIQTKAKDPYYILMNDPNKKPEIKINGKKIDWTDEQLQYFKDQKDYHLKEIQALPWTDQYKATESTARAKTDLQVRYGTELKLTDGE